MADFQGSTFAGTQRGGNTGSGKASGARSRTKIRETKNTFTTTGAEAVGDRLLVGFLPVGGSFRSVRVTASATLGAATLAIGSATAPGKYRAAATQTTPDVPTVSAPAAALAQANLTAEETVWATVGAAGLPAGVTLVLEIDWTEAA